MPDYISFHRFNDPYQYRAEDKARELLKRFLTPEQWEHYLRNREIREIGPDGMEYILSSSGVVVRHVLEPGKRDPFHAMAFGRWCIQQDFHRGMTYDDLIPMADAMLTVLMIFRSGKLYGIGNWTLWRFTPGGCEYISHRILPNGTCVRGHRVWTPPGPPPVHISLRMRVARLVHKLGGRLYDRL